MSSKWHEKKKKLAEQEFERSLLFSNDDTTKDVSKLMSEVAMGGGDEELFEKKMTKEEKKALAKAKREAKKKSKVGSGNDTDGDGAANATPSAEAVLSAVAEGPSSTERVEDDGIDHEAADALAAAGTICTFSSSRKGVDARSRDINVQHFTLQHMGTVMLDDTEIVLNHGNRYGLIGRNGCGKSTLLKALGARAIPVPASIDIFFLDQEVEPSDTVTALDAVMSVDEERLRLEKIAEDLNHVLAELADKIAAGDNDTNDDSGRSFEQQQDEVMEAVHAVYERLDALDADTAEVRARSILSGLGFTHEMQGKLTRDFSGGWRMRVSLARALFLQPCCLVLDEPTNHLGTYTEKKLYLCVCLCFLWKSFSQRFCVEIRHGSSHLVGRLSFQVESNLATRVAFARFLEQCVYAHDPLHQQETTTILRWKL
jgi:ATP-binding cassette subfamily F protein 2